MTLPSRTIICVDCGETAHLLTPFDPAELPPPPGMAVTYRCSGCGERFDLVWEEVTE
jgi:hypothetical protein